MSGLSVKCPNAHKKEAPPIIFGIRHLVKDFLIENGFGEGQWNINFFRKVGGDGGKLKRIFLKKEEEDKIILFVRPKGKDSSWLIEVTTPEKVSIEYFKKRITDNEEEAARPKVVVQNDESQSRRKSVICNQIGRAVITKLTNIGADAIVEVGMGKAARKYNTFLPSSDLGNGNYDPKELLRLKVGDALKVVVFNVNEEEGTAKCSSHYDGYSDSKRMNDKFTGHKNDDDTFPLNTFCDGLREIKLVKYVSELLPDRTTPISHKSLEDLCLHYFEKEYGQGGNLIISHGQFMGLFHGLVDSKRPLMYKVDQEGYLITESAWKEFDSQNRFKKLNVQIEQLPPLETSNLAIGLLPVVQELQHTEPPLEHSAPPAEPSLLEPSLLNALEFHAKEIKCGYQKNEIARLKEIIEMIEIELEDTENFLKRNAHLKDRMDKLIESATNPDTNNNDSKAIELVSQ